ncbi:hypothetical protein [Caldimonas sp. KR1-144]|uniref:hypothetical protein n=1 Tax=Caldimonas sp. KR1-144 TaxID=3400911 RepID=UPI003C0D3F9F
MPSVNFELREEEIAHQVNLQRYSTGVVRRLIGILNRADAELAAALQGALDRLPAESFTVERLEMLLGSIRAINLRAYEAVGRELTVELRELATYEANYQRQLFESVIPSQVIAQVGIAQIAVEQVYGAALSQPMRGRLLMEWASSLEEGRRARIRDAIRLGYVEGQTIQQIVQRIRGTRARGYQDGIIEIDRRHAEAVVRTAVSHVAGFVQDRFFAENEDLIKALAWTSVLDARTTVEICVPRDGKQYHPVTHRPIGHNLKWMGGPGRAHWCCRSTKIPITRSYRELGIDVDELPPGDRASMDGTVPAATTYKEWLLRQSAARQDDVLGPTRGQLLRKGGLQIDRFWTDKGAFLDLDDLRERDAAAFRKAGV